MHKPRKLNTDFWSNQPWKNTQGENQWERGIFIILRLEKIFFYGKILQQKNTQTYLELCAKQPPQNKCQNTSKFMPEFMCCTALDFCACCFTNCMDLCPEKYAQQLPRFLCQNLPYDYLELCQTVPRFCAFSLLHGLQISCWMAQISVLYGPWFPCWSVMSPLWDIITLQRCTMSRVARWVL